MRFLRPSTIAAVLVATCCLSGCQSGDITYAGRQTPLVGTCEPASDALLVDRGGRLRFIPSAGTLALTGTAAADGRLAAGLVLTGADHKPYTLSFAGVRRDRSIAGRYVTPHCRYAVHLDRTGG